MQVIRADDTGRMSPRDPVPEHVAASATEPAGYPVVQVEWHDAWFDLDEPGPADRRVAYPVRTVGYLVGDGPSVLSDRPGGAPGRRGLPRGHPHPAADRGACRSAASDGALTSYTRAVVPSTDPREGGMHLMAATWVLAMPHPSGIGS